MFSRILIANRGEIAIRIAEAAADLGVATLAVHSTDDADSLHVRRADAAAALPGRGAGAYLDIEAVVAAAIEGGCDAVHPGYGFLSENAAFARRCAEAGLVFIGPRPEALDLFGDKLRARTLAVELGVPVAGGAEAAPCSGGFDLARARAFREALPEGEAMILKAVAGGGGRGMRVVGPDDDLDAAFARCAAEAQAAFGAGALYAERLIREARHIEVQVIGDGQSVIHAWERECTLQRRHQKLVEIAPAPNLDPPLREALLDAALRMARAADYDSLGTFEFLVEPQAPEGGPGFVFIEANPRLQVEHTVTEAVTGLDLVALQIRVAAGERLSAMGLGQAEVPAPRGHAIQLRVNAERMDETGAALAAGGALSVFEPPSGPGVRVDAYGYAGYRIGAAFDSLLAKVVVHSPAPDYARAVGRAKRALARFRVAGAETNLPFLRALLERPEVAENRVSTRFVDAHGAELVRAAAAFAAQAEAEAPEAVAAPAAPGLQPRRGTASVAAPMLATVVEYPAAEGDAVAAGQAVAILEALKMQHVITADRAGLVAALGPAPGETVQPGEILALIEPRDDLEAVAAAEEAVDLDFVRPDLAAVFERRRRMSDAGRPRQVARRHALGLRTARENIERLLDPGSFHEYGSFVLAPQRARRSYEELLDMSPADGLIMGLGEINGDRFDETGARAAVISYDWTVFAGTQGIMGHKKTDRMLKLVERMQTPLVLLAEGGGGRPGDSEFIGPAGLELMTFWYFARLSGLVPVVGVANRFCFAGNVALLGMCDVIIATRDSNIGMGGPSMIEGGGLGKVAPTEIGPSDVQTKNGVIDILVEDEDAAMEAARRYLSYFQGPVAGWSCADQRHLRRAIPENRLRVYEVREVIDLLCDDDSVLELRRDFGVGCVTALVRIEGRPMGLIANNPKHLGGAVDADAADKSARFMQLCDAFDLPIVMLCDTPGFMVGVESEKTAQVRHVSRLFVQAANLSVPVFTVVLRKGYGLGALGSAGGGFHAPNFLVSWPTGEFGGMGLEGFVQLAYARELAAIEAPDAREAEYQRLVAEMYDKGKAISMAEYFEIDEVIDPAETRGWLMRGLKSCRPPLPRAGKKRPNVDTW